MLKEIPVPKNHRISGFSEVSVMGSSEKLYKPIFCRIIPLGSIVTDGLIPLLLIADDKGLNALNEVCTLTDYKPATDKQVNEFLHLLNQNGLYLDGKEIKKKNTWWKPVYSETTGFTPMEMTIGTETYRRHHMWSEVYDTREDCANWCNAINGFLRRDYAEV